MLDRNKMLMATTAAVLLLGAAAALSDGEGEKVCQGPPAVVVVVPFTSVSDIETAKALTPGVTEQALVRVARTCGTVGAAIAVANVQSDLVLETEPLTPQLEEANDRTPVVRKMERAARSFYREKLLTPLEKMDGTSGSPYLGALAKLADEIRVHGLGTRLTLLLVGDGIAVEKSPSGRRVDLRSRRPDHRALDEFVERMQPLEGACVMLLGAGAVSGLDGTVLRDAQTLLERTVEKAGAQFVATRSGLVPRDCTEGGR